MFVDFGLLKMRARPRKAKKGDGVPTILFVIVVRLVMMSIAAMANHRNAPKPKPLCNECAFAHIQFGACGRSTISCTSTYSTALTTSRVNGRFVPRSASSVKSARPIKVCEQLGTPFLVRFLCEKWGCFELAKRTLVARNH